MSATLAPGASVARLAQAEDVNANQVFLWRRAYRKGELLPGSALLPVVIEADASRGEDLTSDLEVALTAPEQPIPVSPSGAIHIELPGRAAISVERGADRALLRTVLARIADHPVNRIADLLPWNMTTVQTHTSQAA